MLNFLTDTWRWLIWQKRKANISWRGLLCVFWLWNGHAIRPVSIVKKGGSDIDSHGFRRRKRRHDVQSPLALLSGWTSIARRSLQSLPCRRFRLTRSFWIKPGDYCLLENVDVTPYLLFTKKVILFHWNRAYPFDVKFPIKLDSGKWRLISTEDFPGSSHEKITMESCKTCQVMSIPNQGKKSKK